MYLSSRFGISRLLAVALVMSLFIYGVPALHAKPVQQSCTTCPEDPHKVHEAQEKAQREEAHAQHEAAEQAERDQKAAEHAQHEAAEACERNQSKIKHAQHELEEAQAKTAERQEDVSKLGGNMCPSTEKTEPEIVESKPAPVPPPPPPPIIELTPMPAPLPPAPEPPKELPRTASPLDLIGLIGLASLSGYGFLRRRS